MLKFFLDLGVFIIILESETGNYVSQLNAFTTTLMWKLCEELLPALVVGKIHQTSLYTTVFGKDWKQFELGDDMFHKLLEKYQVL